MDFIQAFDSVQMVKLYEVMQDMGIFFKLKVNEDGREIHKSQN